MATFDGWLQIVLLLAAGVSGYLLVKSAWSKKNPSEYVLAAALFTFGIARTVSAFNLFEPYTGELIEWSDLIAITVILSGLFLRIRLSKPRFSRYPLPLVFLPLTVLIVYPLILNAEVIKSLLFSTFAGGSIIVALMVSITRHILYERQSTLLTGLFILLLSFIANIWYELEGIGEMLIIYQILLAVGMLITAIGIYKLRQEPII